MSFRPRARALWLVPALLAAAAAHPGLAHAAGLDFWNLADVRADLNAAVAANAVLDDRDAVILHRITIKEDLIAALVAGDADLAAVAARFLDLNADEPTYLAIIRGETPGDSDLERSAHNVVRYATDRVADPAARAALGRRLAAELAGLQHPDHPARR